MQPATQPPFPIDARSALVVVDVQNGFLETGELPVRDGSQVVPLVNRLARVFPNVIVTQDWHPPGHASFASSHPGRQPFETIEMGYGPQVLWPDHCIQGTASAELAPGLDLPMAQLLIRKGFHPGVDSYSAFLEADRRTRTGLTGWLRERGIERLAIAGLATDFCVAWTALDARADGFEAAVVEDACRAIDLDGSLADAWRRMEAAGVQRTLASDWRTA